VDVKFASNVESQKSTSNGNSMGYNRYLKTTYLVLNLNGNGNGNRLIREKH
jgi:hypothetical protein